MKENAQTIAAEIHRLAESMSRLRSLGVIRSQKIVGDIGEWVAAALFGGVLAESKNQKGWDIVCSKENIQVRAHAKAEGNTNQWTSVRDISPECSKLAIVVLSHALQVHRVFLLPTKVAEERAKKQRLSWANISDFEVDARKLPAYRRLLPLFAGTSINAFKVRRAKRARP